MQTETLRFLLIIGLLLLLVYLSQDFFISLLSSLGILFLILFHKKKIKRKENNEQGIGGELPIEDDEEVDA